MKQSTGGLVQSLQLVAVLDKLNTTTELDAWKDAQINKIKDYVPSEYQHFPIHKIENSYKKRLGELQSSKGSGSNTTQEERGNSLQLATASVPAHMENSASVEQGSHGKEGVQQAEQADAVEA